VDWEAQVSFSQEASPFPEALLIFVN
jgi:hypothetical protein